MILPGKTATKLRVCHMIAGDQWAGAEVHVAHLLSGLAQYKDIELSAILFAEGCLAQELRQSGISVTVLEEERLGRLRLIREIARTLCNRPVDILHTHRYKGNILGGLAGRWARIPWFVRTQHGRLEPYRGMDRLKRVLYEGVDYVVNRFATNCLIAVSNDLYAHMLSHFPAKRVALIRNGIEPSRVKTTVPPIVLRQELGLAEDTPVFGTAGRLVPVKGLGYFLQAAREIVETLPEARFLIVGEGPLKFELKQRAQDLGIDSAVTFLGFRRDILDVLNILDVFVMPSLSEGVPMVLLEAMILGKPIVASAAGGIPEVLHDPLGWLVPPQDVQALKIASLEAFGLAANGQHAVTVKNRVDEIAALASTMCKHTYDLYLELTERRRRKVRLK